MFFLLVIFVTLLLFFPLCDVLAPLIGNPMVPSHDVPLPCGSW
jgi:hypothetical protein